MRNGNHAVSVCHALWYCYFRLNLSIELATWGVENLSFFCESVSSLFVTLT